MEQKRVLILGATGMLGHTMMRLFASDPSLIAYGTVRSSHAASLLPSDIRDRLLVGVDVESVDSLASAFALSRPDVVVNCVGVVKQLSEANNPLFALPINAILPHRLLQLCAIGGARLVQVSTDCVFSGKKGCYVESDLPDATDLYGRSKLLGEVAQPPGLTLRTSIVGHELGKPHGLVGWFLSQQGSVRGFRRAIFSGLPTVELANIIRKYVIPDASLNGVYHVAAEPISKLDLLELVASVYGHEIQIVPDDTLEIDRSLDATRFRAATGYSAPAWPELIRRMHDFH